MWSKRRHVQWHFTLMSYYYKCLYMCRDGKSDPEKVTVGSHDITGYNASLTYCYLDLGPLEGIGLWENSPPKDWENLGHFVVWDQESESCILKIAINATRMVNSYWGRALWALKRDICSRRYQLLIACFIQAWMLRIWMSQITSYIGKERLKPAPSYCLGAKSNKYVNFNDWCQKVSIEYPELLSVDSL